MIILFVNKFMFFEFIFLTVNNFIFSLKLNKYNSLMLYKYTLAGCKIMSWVQVYFIGYESMYFLNFALFTNGQP